MYRLYCHVYIGTYVGDALVFHMYPQQYIGIVNKFPDCFPCLEILLLVDIVIALELILHFHLLVTPSQIWVGLRNHHQR